MATSEKFVCIVNSLSNFCTLQEQTKNLMLKNEMRTGGFASKSAAEVSF